MCLVDQLEDESVAVRLTGLQAFARVEPKILAEHVHIVEQQLQDCSAPVRGEALATLSRLEPKVLAECAVAITPLLRDQDERVRERAIATLSRLEPDVLKRHVDAIVEHTQGGDAAIRVTAVTALRHCSPEVLARYAHMLKRLLSDADAGVCSEALRALGQLPQSHLLPYAVYIVPHLDSAESSVHEAAMETVKKLPASYQGDFHYLPALDTLLHVFVRHNVDTLVDPLLAQHGYRLVNARNMLLNTPLHVAASCGRLHLCQRLVNAGALVRMRNTHRKRPEDLAKEGGHTTVAYWLQGKVSISTVRGGCGDAWHMALQDPRTPFHVEWYTMPMEGAAGFVGIKHSLLRIIVGSALEPHAYVIEKASVQSFGNVVPEELRNGVYVSHWSDVMHSIESDPLHVLHQDDIENNTGKERLCVRSLWEVASEVGDYEVSKCNCHHAALRVYNSCAKEHARVRKVPNLFLSHLSAFLQQVGVDVEGSESASAFAA